MFRRFADPFRQHLKRDLLAAGVSEDEIKKIDNEIKAQVVEAADFAEQMPEPEPQELYTDVLVGQY